MKLSCALLLLAVPFAPCPAAAAQSAAHDVWTDRQATLPFAARRSYAYLAYDSQRQRILRFGGWDGFAPHDDLWSWNGDAWTRLMPANQPPPRFAHGNLVYDTARDRAVVFGGRRGPQASIILGDTWEYDGVDWTRMTPSSSPSPRGLHHMVYDEARAELILFGGFDGTWLDDTWSWDGSDWTQLAPANRPSPRAGGQMAYDSVRQRVVLFGGWDTSSLDDTWEWDGTNWTESPSAVRPEARSLGGATYDSAGQRVLMYGGWDAAGNWKGDLWEWDGNEWSEVLTARTPSPRCCPGFEYDPARGRVVLFGGCDNSVVRDTWELHRGAAARLRIYGTQDRAPRLMQSNAELPWLGEDFDLTLRLPTGASLAFGLAGLQMNEPPRLLPATYPLLVGRIFDIEPLPGGPTATWSLSIPPDPDLMGTEFFLQFVTRAPATGEWVFSNPAAGVVGAR